MAERIPRQNFDAAMGTLHARPPRGTCPGQIRFTPEDPVRATQPKASRPPAGRQWLVEVYRLLWVGGPRWGPASSAPWLHQRGPPQPNTLRSQERPFGPRSRAVRASLPDCTFGGERAVRESDVTGTNLVSDESEPQGHLPCGSDSRASGWSRQAYLAGCSLCNRRPVISRPT